MTPDRTQQTFVAKTIYSESAGAAVCVPCILARGKIMMMAHDSSPGGSGLADETIEELRSALLEYIDAPSRGERLHAALHTLAGEARERSILPEKLLVFLKDMWYSLPSVQRMKEQDQQIRLLQRAVTMCIKQYYAE